MSVERRVGWYRTKGEGQVDDNQNSKLIFAIVNEPRDIGIIKDRIHELFAQWGHIEAERDIAKGRVGGTDLSYLCFSFETSRGSFTPSTANVYSGLDIVGRPKIRRDEKLGRIKSDEAINNYIRTHYCGL